MPFKTTLGKRIGKANEQAGLSKINNIVTKMGYIKECVGDRYSYYVLLDGEEKPIGPIELEGLPEVLAFTAGPPIEQVGKRIKIEYKGTSAKRGRMSLIDERGLTPGAKYESAQAANELAVKGSAFAPPGAGV